LEKSRAGGVRLLTIENQHIEWAHLYQAYRWDQNKTSLKIHEDLTEEHFNLGNYIISKYIINISSFLKIYIYRVCIQKF